MLLLTSFSKAPAPAASPYTAFIFLSETCPICQSETIELSDLYQKYALCGITFIGVFPNATVSTPATIARFKEKYKLPFELQLDKTHELVHTFGATTTPQVFLVRSADKKVLYSGQVDNSYERIGQRRTVVTNHYLQRAIESALHGVSPDPARTTAVGCFIINPKK